MLLKTLTEIQQHIRISNEVTFEQSFAPFIEETEQKYIIKYLGQAQYDELQVYYDAELNNVETLNKLLEHTQRALSKFVMAAAARFMDLEVSEGGFTVNSTQTAAPASVTRVANLIKATVSQGWDSIEIILKYMEDNVDSFPLWSGSDAYTLQKSTLIQSASDFHNHYPINESRLWFYSAKGIMRNVDDSEIKSKISEDLYATLLSEINSGSVSVANKAILSNLKYAIAYITKARDLVANKYTNDELDYKPTVDLQVVLEADREKIERMGVFYLNKALNTILNNVDDYPDYKNSDLYDENSESFENSADYNFFKAGG